MRGLAAMALLLAAGWPAPDAFAKPRGCFTKTEEGAEQMVRHGVELREGARGCDGDPWNAGTSPLWDQVDKEFGDRFAHQTKIRHDAFVREFENDAENRLSMWNGRIVFYFRNYPLSPVYCAGIKRQLETMKTKGWRSFAKDSALSRDAVRMDYKACDR